MIDIFPEILTDADFSYFTEATYSALSGVLNDVTAMYITEYLQRSDAMPEVVAAIQKYLGDTVALLAFPAKLKQRGITDFVLKVTPETMETSGDDLDEVIEKLGYLQDNSTLITTHLPVRTKAEFSKFIAEIQNVITRLHGMGATMSYPNVIDRINANKFLFYIPNEKARSTGLAVVSSRKRRWTLALEGARYIKECDKRGIPQNVRRNF